MFYAVSFGVVDRIPKLYCQDIDKDGTQPGELDSASDDGSRFTTEESDLGRNTADSSYVFERGAPVQVGTHGQDDFVFSSGQKLTNKGSSTFVFEGGTGIGAQGFDYVARVEDQTDFDYNDCNVAWDETPLDNGQGYIRLAIEHRKSGNGHEWWIGGSTNRYNANRHAPGDAGDFTIVWQGRMYENGNVTDPSGSVLGTWD